MNVCTPTSWPSARMRRTRSGRSATLAPRTKKVALAPWAARTSRIFAVHSVGPSSKVRTTCLSGTRRPDCGLEASTIGPPSRTCAGTWSAPGFDAGASAASPSCPLVTPDTTSISRTPTTTTASTSQCERGSLRLFAPVMPGERLLRPARRRRVLTGARLSVGLAGRRVHVLGLRRRVRSRSHCRVRTLRCRTGVRVALRRRVVRDRRCGRGRLRLGGLRRSGGILPRGGGVRLRGGGAGLCCLGGLHGCRPSLGLACIASDRIQRPIRGRSPPSGPCRGRACHPPYPHGRPQAHCLWPAATGSRPVRAGGRGSPA